MNSINKVIIVDWVSSILFFLDREFLFFLVILEAGMRFDRMEFDDLLVFVFEKNMQLN